MKVVGGCMKFKIFIWCQKMRFNCVLHFRVFTVLILTIRDFIKFQFFWKFWAIEISVHYNLSTLDFNFSRKFKFEVWLSFIYLKNFDFTLPLGIQCIIVYVFEGQWSSNLWLNCTLSYEFSLTNGVIYVYNYMFQWRANGQVK